MYIYNPRIFGEAVRSKSRYYFSAICIIGNIFLDAAGALYAAALMIKLVFPAADKEPFVRAFMNEKSATIPFEGKSWTIPPHTKSSLLLDNETHTIGMPEMIFGGGAGSQIKITYAEALYDENMKKGDRDQVTGKKIMGYYDLIYPDGGKKRKFTSMGMKAYRFVQRYIETKNEPLTIDDFYGVYTAYPFEITGSFESDNRMLNKISCRTLRNSSFEDFIDPYFEQLQYVGDARIEALVALKMSNDLRLMRKAIETFDNSRLPIGLTQSRYPSYIVQIIPPYSLVWIMMIHDYMMYGGDEDFIKGCLPGVEAVLGWFADHVDSTGMLYDLHWWNFTDWAVGYPNGIPPGADDGQSATVSLQYVLGLQRAAEVYAWLGYEERSSELNEMADRVRSSVNTQCYDSSKKMFNDAKENKSYSQHTQILAILTDLVPAEEQAALLERTISDKSLIQSTIYYKFYLFEAMCKAGLGDRYITSLENRERMVNDGLTTFAETDIDPRSECHGWSASPAYHLQKIVAGIRPAEAGFGNVIIEPHLSGLKNINATVPSPFGDISVAYSLTGKREALITLPNKMGANLLGKV